MSEASSPNSESSHSESSRSESSFSEQAAPTQASSPASPPAAEQNLNIAGSVLESVQIGGIAGRDLTLTQIQGGVGTINVFGTVTVDQATSEINTPPNKTEPSTTESNKAEQHKTGLSKTEYRWRQVLLAKVKQYWIDGVLKKSLHAQVFIELGLSDSLPDSAFQSSTVQTEHVQQSIPQNAIPLVQNPTAVFEEFSAQSSEPFPEGAQAADIFAELGTGRTLLILGEPGAGKTVTLLKLASSLIERAEQNLSQPLPVVLNLSAWAIEQKPIAEWLVQALFETYGASQALCQTWIAQEQLILLLDGLDEVMARYRDDCVQALNQFIQSHGLTEIVVCSRIQDYAALNHRLKLRSAICIQPLSQPQINQFLWQVGPSLSDLKAALDADADLQQMATSPLMLSIMSLTYQNASALTQASDTKSQRQRLFEAYVERLFSRRSNTQLYAKEQTLRWLGWLARHMVATSQTMFWIERLQPSCLARSQKRKYKLVLLLLLVLALGTLPGIIYGLVASIIVISQNSYGLSMTLLVCVFGSLITAIIFSLSAGVFSGIWMLFDRGEIKPVETLQWSWQAVKESLPHALSLGLWCGLVCGATMSVIATLAQAPTVGLITGLLSFVVFVLFYLIMACLIGGMRGPAIARTSFPNQGIIRSARNGLKFFLPSSLIIGCLIALWSYIAAPGGAMYWGILAILWGGVFACFQHVALRYVLFRQHVIPWNYARFLDTAAEQLFLQKVGGGYIFMHRMLLEHFAEIKSPEVGQAKQTGSTKPVK